MSRDGGESFGPPQRASLPEDRVREGDVPSVALLPSHGMLSFDSTPEVFVVWRGAQEAEGEPAAVIAAAHSGDGGRSFESFAVSRADVSVCGAPSSFTTDARHVMVAWQDCDRNVFVAEIDAATGKTLASRHARVDACGGAGLASGAATGTAPLVMRARRPGGGVDLATIAAPLSPQSEPIWAGFEWPESACGDLTGAVAVGEGALHLAWIDNGAGHVFYASLRDGKIATPPQAMEGPGAGSFRRAQLVFDVSGGVVMAWEEERDAKPRVLIRQLAPAHHGPVQPLPATAMSGNASGSQPAIGGLPGGVVVAWNGTRANTIVVRRLGLDAVCTAPSASAAGRGQRS